VDRCDFRSRNIRCETNGRHSFSASAGGTRSLTYGRASGTLALFGKADVMKIQCFPAAVMTAATLTLWVSSAPSAVAQVSATPDPTLSVPAVTAERVQLSGGAEDVLKLSRAKVHDDVTVAFIQNSDRRFNLTASDILYLRKEGVSDRVLTAMLSPQSPPAVAPPPSESTTAAEANAPQYITPPATTTVVESAPYSTVYLASTPAYYSFYDPWPYYTYTYPALSLGFYWGWGWNWGWGWGNCGYAYAYPYSCNGYWNNYCHNGYYPPPPPNGNNPPPNGNRPPPPQGNPATPGARSGQPETMASRGRHPSSANPTAPNSSLSRVESRSGSAASAGRPTSVWNRDGKQAAATRTSSANTQTTRPTTVSTGYSVVRTYHGHQNVSCACCILRMW